MNLSLISGTYAICRLSKKSRVPAWATRGTFSNLVKTKDEISIVCEGKFVPRNVTASRGWKCVRVDGTMDLSMIGVMASLAVPLAKAKISLFAISTFDTDYFLVNAGDLSAARRALARAGHPFTSPRQQTRKNRRK